MKYFLTVTSKRKNGKRHKVGEFQQVTTDIIQYIESIVNNRRFQRMYDPSKYNIEIYNEKWELVKVV